MWDTSRAELKMNAFMRLIINFFLGASERGAIQDLEKKISEQSGDMRAISHIELYNIYHRLAEKNMVFGGLLDRLARQHVDEAVIWAKTCPQPWVLVGTFELQRGDFWKARESLGKGITLQRSLLQNAKIGNAALRLDLCSYLAQAGRIEFQIGQYRRAREAFVSALEELKLLSPAVRSQRKDLENSIYSGTVGSLLLEHKYAEAGLCRFEPARPTALARCLKRPRPVVPISLRIESASRPNTRFSASARF
jgi:hypothetical protein